MVVAPGKKREIEAANGKEKERRGGNKRNEVGGIDSGKPCPPEPSGVKSGASVGENENEPREDEEEIHSHITHAGKVPVPPRSASQDSYDLQMEQHHVNRREEPYRSECLDTRTPGGGGGDPTGAW